MGAAIGRRKATVLVLGLDNSGKTTVVSSLMKQIERYNPPAAPSVGVTEHKIQSENSMTMNVCDVSGKLRGAWEKLFKQCDGVIFVLDSSDSMRLAVAKEEVWLMLSHEDLDGVPMLFLANKMDVDEALDSAGCTKALDLDHIRRRRWKIYSSNAVTGEGLAEAVGWFTDELKTNSRPKPASR